jgi:hypothetical protein
MQEQSRRTFLMRYAAMALAAAMAPNGARAAADDGDASKDFPDQGLPNKTVYGPPPRPYPTLHPQRTPPVALYGPPPRPYPTLDPQRPPPFAPLYGPPPRNPLD